MARPTISQVRALGDFATVVNWDLQFVRLPRSVSASSNDINFRCESTDIPKSTGTSTQIQLRGLPPIKQPGIYVPSGTLTLTLNETIDSKISNMIAQWREACYAIETGKSLPKADVEAQIRLTRLDRQDKEIYEYMIYGAFLEDHDPGGQLGSTSADVLKPTITLSYDYYKERKL